MKFYTINHFHYHHLISPTTMAVMVKQPELRPGTVKLKLKGAITFRGVSPNWKEKGLIYNPSTQKRKEQQDN